MSEPVCDHGVERRLMARLASNALERGWGRIDFDVWLRYDAAKGWVERLRRMGRARLNSER